jgi:hypothetical protein
MHLATLRRNGDMAVRTACHPFRGARATSVCPARNSSTRIDTGANVYTLVPINTPSRSVSMRRLLIVFVASVGLAAAALSAYAQSAAGTVTAIHGQVQDQRSGAPINLAQGSQVFVSDRITTGPSSTATIILTDQSQLDVYPSTTIAIDQHLVGAGGRTSTYISLAQGFLHSFVHLVSVGNPPNFEVHTPNAVAAARGTRYDTRYSGGTVRADQPSCSDFTDVAVQEGTVEVTSAANPNAPGVMVAAGYTTSVPCALPPLPVAPLGTTGRGGVAGFTGVPPSVGGSAPPPQLPPPPSVGHFPQ